MTTQNNRHDSFDYSEKTKSKHVVTFEHNSGGKGGTLPSTNKSTMPEPPIPGKNRYHSSFVARTRLISTL
ncbi:hypothetical protein, partial [Escherichia coli]|uniref:hypothetical protein n=1 Tax=Escherichia coli TaxID=562 RepID=UPI00112F1B8D